MSHASRKVALSHCNLQLCSFAYSGRSRVYRLHLIPKLPTSSRLVTGTLLSGFEWQEVPADLYMDLVRAGEKARRCV
eukprot:4196935-Amphidinium_carterae.1